MCVCFLTDAGRPDCSELATASAHDDGTDALTVHLHLQSAHSVPEKLQTDLRPALAQGSHEPLTTPQSPPELPHSISDGARHEPGPV